MYLYLGGDGCTTVSKNAKRVVFGVSDWVLDDLVYYGSVVCCKDVGDGVVCTGGATKKTTRVPYIPCVDVKGRVFIINKDSGLDLEERLPMACFSYAKTVTSRDVKYAVDVINKVYGAFIRKKHLIVDEEMNVLGFSSEAIKAVDMYVKMVKNKSAKNLVVIL
jgi:hypothetical protein